MADKLRKNFEEPSISVSELSKTLYDTNLKLYETIKERNEMFANISHDLRAPITAIHNCIEYLSSLDHIDESDIKEVLPMLSSRSAMLERMIEDVFLLTKIDFARNIFNFERVPADAFFEDIFYTYKADEQYSSRDLSLSIAPDCSVSINVDLMYMKRAIDNIFKNALKFTEAGNYIKMSVQRSAEQTLEIIISNDGQKISEKNLPHIFDRTFTASDSRTPSSDNGMGLGLSICRGIVERHGGSIYAVSGDAVEKGCEFHILLPVIYCSHSSAHLLR